MNRPEPIELENNLGPDAVTGEINRVPWKAYDVDEMDQYIAAKDAEIQRLRHAISNGDVNVMGWIDRCQELEEKVETLKNSNAELENLCAELKDKCEMHDFFWDGCGFAKRGFKNTIAVSEAFDKLEAENAELKQKLESVQASMYADVVDAGMRERSLRRALHKTCANWAACRACLLEYIGFILHAKKWERMYHRCREKAEEYK